MTAAQSPSPPTLDLQFGSDALIPAVIQDASNDKVLMVGFMNAEALEQTRATGRVHFWSRSRRTLWRKGETSGHEQIVQEIRVNCERNSLLILVHQIGAVCHDGFESCYYRRLDPNDRLTTVLDRTFDPVVVYNTGGGESEQQGQERRLEQLSRVQFGAYVFLKETDLSSLSGTAARLRGPLASLVNRLADELNELAGALDGSHSHGDQTADVILESSQVVYWALLVTLRAGADWERVRTDRALATAEPELPMTTASALLRADATNWRNRQTSEIDVVARCQGSLALVGQACASAGVDPRRLIEADLAELRAKSYLASYFDSNSTIHGDLI